MTTLAALTRDIFVLAHEAASDGISGRAWEDRLTDHFSRSGIRTDAMPGGSSILGHAAVSGLSHQIDATAAVENAIVIGEWKAYRSAIPKNELIRFKAVTDDFYLEMGPDAPRSPIIRLFGGPGRYGDDLRRYAAQHGILLIDPDRWPASVLTANLRIWSRVGMAPPSRSELRLLRMLYRPMQQLLRPLRDGSFLSPPTHPKVCLDSALMCHDHWSDMLWEAIDEHPKSFEMLMCARSSRRRTA